MPAGMTIEQQTGDLLPRLAGIDGCVLDRGTRRNLFDCRRRQRPADPVLDLVALLAEVAMRTVMAKLEVAIVVTTNLMRAEGPPLEPKELEVAELDPRRTPFTEREHEVTVL